jgi:SAM-dependent methyltransferase
MQQVQREAKKPSVNDHQWWEQLYQSGKTPWDLGKPSPPLVTFLKSPYAVAPGKVAVLGCGHGHDCMPLVQAGFEVTGIDFAPSACKSTLDKFQRAGVAGKKGYLLNRDVFDIHEYDGYYDCIVEHCFFPALDPARRRTYVMTVADLLKPGAKLIAVWWLFEAQGGPPFSLSKDELYSLFDARFSIDIAYTPNDSVPQRRNSELITLMTKR